MSVTKPVSFEFQVKVSNTGMGCYILTIGLTVNNSDWTVSQTSLTKILVVRLILVLWGKYYEFSCFEVLDNLF